jgi:hypothetical protein
MEANMASASKPRWAIKTEPLRNVSDLADVLAVLFLDLPPNTTWSKFIPFAAPVRDLDIQIKKLGFRLMQDQHWANPVLVRPSKIDGLLERIDRFEVVGELSEIRVNIISASGVTEAT